MVVIKQSEFQKSSDVLTFYAALFFKTAAKNNLKREDFQDLIKYTYGNLPVRGGGLGEDGFWENICNAHKISIIYTNGGIDEKVLMRLADSIWLVYDQDLKNEDSA